MTDKLLSISPPSFLVGDLVAIKAAVQESITMGSCTPKCYQVVAIHIEVCVGGQQTAYTLAGFPHRMHEESLVLWDDPSILEAKEASIQGRLELRSREWADVDKKIDLRGKIKNPDTDQVQRKEQP